MVIDDRDYIQDEEDTVGLLIWEQQRECLSQKSQIVDFSVASVVENIKEAVDK